MEQPNLGNDAVKSSRRRLSSILKAPRTSMKIHGAEQEEQKQEEIVKPVEKKRNSRRVSFATTNNVRVFTNDAKSESPVLASIQNINVAGDRPNEKILRFVDEGSNQIKGLETLLNTPLYLTQHNENFFSDPVLQDDCVDRTMLLGEDTGYMDITQSHTITIDKDYEIEEETNSDFSINMAQMVRGDLNVANQKGLPHEAKAERKNAANDSDFSAFLASLSLPTVNTIKPRNSENELGNVFCSANTSTEIDKENQVPSFLMKQHPGDKGNPQQPRGLQHRRSHVAFVEDDVEATRSHTVIIENKDNPQPFTPSVTENQGSVAFMKSAFSNVPDDMELTLSQTAAINVKVTENITRNVQAFLMKQHPGDKGNPQQPQGLQRRRSRVGFVEDDVKAAKCHTVVTENKDSAQPFTPSVTENQGSVAIMKSAFSNIPDDMELTLSQTAAINIKVTENITRNVQAALNHRSHHFSEDDNAMEMTGAFDVSVREKNHTMSMKEQAQPSVPTIRRICSFNVSGNGETTDQNKAGYLQSNLSIAQTANSEDMEMTGTFDVSVREKDHTMSMKEQAQPPIPKVRRMSSLNVMGNAETTDQNKAGYFQSNVSIVQAANSDDMEMTGALDISIGEKEEALFPKVSRMSTFDSFGNGEIMDRNKSSNNFIAPTANSDDMEMTQCQTIVLEDKPSSGNKPFSNSRKSLPLVPLYRTVREDDHTTGLKEETPHPIPRVNKMPCFDLVGNRVIMDHNKSGHLPIAQTANSDEMEMTQCQTIFLEAKQVSGDNPLSNSRKSWPRTSVYGTEGSDGMDMTQAFTGRIMLNALSASKKERAESILIPATITSAQHNESDCMDLTCQPCTFDGISPPSPDEMELTRCTTINIDSNRTWLGSAVDITGTRRVPSSANQTITVVEPMEMTEVHMAPVSVQKHKAFMTRRKSGARMMSLMCDPENTEADNRQTDFSNPDDMDMTQCQTVVLEAENCKRSRPVSNSRKSLNLLYTSSSPDVDGMEITQAHTGNIVLNSFVSNEKRNHERKLLPPAQSCQMEYESDCMEMTCQVNASNLAIPCVDDEMELTRCNTIAFDSKNTLAENAIEIKANESALWASTSVSRCTVSSEEQNEVSEAAKCAINHVFPSRHVFDLDGKNLKHNNTEAISYGAANMQVDRNCEMVHLSDVMTTDEDSNMQVTNVLTVPIETEKSVSFNEKEEANIKTFCGSRNKEAGQALWPKKEQSTSSVQLEDSSSNQSLVDSFIKEELQHAKARRRSLADFQMELHSMSQRIQEEQKVVMGSTTAPLASCSLPETSLKEQCEMKISSEPTSNVTPNVKQQNKSVQNEKTTPFSLKKNAFSSRLSLGGIVPKLPKRATTVTPNKTVTISTNDLQCLQLEKHFDVDEQNSNCRTVNINEEEFPEMSSEEDLSGSLENWPINKQDELDGSLAVPKNEEPLEDDVFESGTSTSPCFKRPHTEVEEDPITAELTKKAYISDMGLDCHEAVVQWEGNLTRHAAQNPKAKAAEDTGVSESTLRYSQFDSHMDGTLGHVFDFNKKLEDGSITVNEFLSHFGINFVIHRSRPSALPDSCRAGETRTMEDLLKEKYIYHPKQRVYEQDCKNLTEIVERLKEQMPGQEKSLGCINGALQQEMCTLSEEQLKIFGSKLKERRVFFGKRSKALSHEMKGVLYSELIKTTQDAKQSLISKIKETDEMIEDLDGCINDLETELASVEAMIMGDHLDAPQTRPALKAKEEDLHKLNSAVTEKEREIGELEIQLRTLESQQEKLQGESSSLKSHLATLNSLNEWHLDAMDERGALFTFLHKTVHLQVNLQTPAGKEWMTEDVERNIDVSFQLHLDVEKSQCHASMVHKLLALHAQSQTRWIQRYPTTRHIPELLHDISLVVGRLRLLGEEIHRLKKWGGLKLRILKITCMDTRVHIIFSSLKAFEKFELSLMVTPDYPFGPLHIQDFKKHMGNTRLSQIEDIISSVKPAKNYLTKVLKKIHDDLLC
ncbi:kinetochore scaffold 1-like isoform X1 [Cyprinus carpio]|uniref:Kinetochore scaffold 1-like isoform X1 n=1 Tax=Cyprinus carpio TaxID=7962 RepID=A0A9Q9WLS3_CYPCA|nr:kinetochore scaffold 1-like isoform X1 [Cyprinus carpio]